MTFHQTSLNKDMVSVNQLKINVDHDYMYIQYVYVDAGNKEIYFGSNTHNDTTMYTHKIRILFFGRVS